MRLYRLLPLLLPSAAHACTVCDSQTGHAVRSGIADHFLSTALLVALPIPLLAFAVLAVHYSMPDLAWPGPDMPSEPQPAQPEPAQPAIV
ncbi:MAG TPA: hypothetical protein VM865_02570 [Acidobacteriaceae bacterium]|jgi:hypothetical protein|nr:hypothetical protein [Acidobacteriaceae bacterium]